MFSTHKCFDDFNGIHLYVAHLELILRIYLKNDNSYPLEDDGKTCI